MKSIPKLLSAGVAAATFLVGGCAVTTVPAIDVSRIKIGDSKQQVLSYLGKPHSVSFYWRLNEEAWTYYQVVNYDENLIIGFKDGDKITSIIQVPYSLSFPFDGIDD